MIGRGGGLLGLAFLLGSAPTPGHAIELDLGSLGPGGLEITDSLQIRYLETNFNATEDDDRVLSILNKLNLVGTGAGFTLGIRIDSAHFPIKECDSEATCLFKDYVKPSFTEDHPLPEKLYLGWSHREATGSVEIRAGDFYTAFGRGMTLNVRKVDELGLDTSVQGGRFVAQSGAFRMEAIAGRTNIQNIAPIDNRTLDDPGDIITGFESSLTAADGTEMGVRAVHIEYHDAEILGHEESATIGGASLSLPDLGGHFAFYGEGAMIASRDYDPQASEGSPFTSIPGKGLYTALNGFFGAFNVLLEAKHYRRFQIAPRDNTLRIVGIVYNAPPTLERFDQLVSSTSDATGSRLRMDYYFRDLGTRVYANGVYYLYGTGGNDPFEEKGKSALHAYVGVRQSFAGGSSVELSGGWRDERLVEPLDPDKSLVRHLWHVEGDVNIPLGGRHSLNIKGEHRTECKPTLSSTDSQCGLLDGEAKGHRFHRTLLTTTYGIQPGFRSSLLFGYTDEQPLAVPTQHFAAQFDWDFRSGSTLRAFGGSLPGGFVCAGGTCVTVPPSSSYRLEVVTRF